MSDKLPAPDFDSQNYDRPNQPFQCGWASEGRACARGPDGSGRCRATFECRPVLKKKSDDDCGEWVCTRPRSQGGNCRNGPLPDGTCACPVPPCRPVPSLRTRRGRICVMISAVTVAALMLLFFLPDYGRFVSPGELSSYHTGPTFVAFKKQSEDEDGCGKCHAGASGGPRDWLSAGLTAQPRPWDLRGLFEPHHDRLTSIDRKCMNCHPKYGFHQPNVTREHSCSLCHLEHQGNGRMPPPRDANCASCHNHADTMRASRERAAKMDAAEFHYWHAAGLRVFSPERPESGFTSVFESFSRNHPAFQLHREARTDATTLRFNHQLHLGRTVRKDGRRLRCDDCHQPDASGAYYQRISFESHCRECHSLQFDAEQPDLRLPHGDREHVKSYLASLPSQYAAAAAKRGLTTTPEINGFVQAQMRRMQEAGLLGRELERTVFLSGDPSRETAPTNLARASFNGCAYCHDVSMDPESGPVVAPTNIPDRWMPRGEFNHAKHLNAGCADCHAMHDSRHSSDISLPTKESCATCHSPKGGVSESCAVCHSYHNVAKRLLK